MHVVDTSPQVNGILLVGSVPLRDSDAVFRLAGSAIGDWLRRLPDGETGERSNWVRWQYAVLADTPQLEPVPQAAGSAATGMPAQLRLVAGAAASEVELPTLGYSAVALDSYQRFSKLKRDGAIPDHCRFQVSLPTPLAPLQFYVQQQDRAALEPIYEASLLRELAEIVSEIPAQDLAIQWDTAVEFGILEGVFPSHLASPDTDIMQRLLRLGDSVPENVELGYHLCYGDAGHKHFIEPADTGLLVQVANGIASGLSRSLQWLHLPVPRERNDVSYYAPLADLRLPHTTELYLGLVHATDGLEGTKRRITTAQQVVKRFGVATECGFGRRLPESIPELLDIHAAVAEPLSTEDSV